jgi:hypothetical protein
MATTPRIRFNHGFWDGHADCQRKHHPLWNRHGRSHFDRVYEAGYWHGRRDDMAEVESSDGAWDQHQRESARKAGRA